MPYIYSYIHVYDTGFAPNFQSGILSLSTCKPMIRKNACIGDFIVGIKNIDGKKYITYIMKITNKMTMEQYDKYTKIFLQEKISNDSNPFGDSIYDFSENSINLRGKIHTENNIKNDLNGKYILLSSEFYYFGKQCINFELPNELKDFGKLNRGYRSKANISYFDNFISFFNNLKERYGLSKIFDFPFDSIKKLNLDSSIYFSNNIQNMIFPQNKTNFVGSRRQRDEENHV
jgi:hypothetical protein